MEKKLKQNYFTMKKYFEAKFGQKDIFIKEKLKIWYFRI